jgi:STAS domain-containing protein
MFRVLRSIIGGQVVFTLSGRITEERVSELTELLASEKDGSPIVLDLDEVRLVHRDGVRFLAECEARGITLQNCPTFVREWIQTGSDSRHEPKSSATS